MFNTMLKLDFLLPMFYDEFMKTYFYKILKYFNNTVFVIIPILVI